MDVSNLNNNLEINNISLTPKLGRSIRCPVTYIHPHFTGNDKGLYATMIGGRIDPSSCLDTCWVDDMAVWWFRATCFHGLKYLCVNREVLFVIYISVFCFL